MKQAILVILVIIGATLLFGCTTANFGQSTNTQPTAGNASLTPTQVTASAQNPANTGAISAQATAGAIQTITLKVTIPCSGHTGLIASEVKKATGIISVNAKQWNVFEITFDSSKTSTEQILALELFKSYPATLQ